MKNEKTDNIDIIIEASEVFYAYKTDELVELEDVKPALNGLSVNIKPGSYTAILGPNGSGKSTFAKMINALEEPDQGSIKVFGQDTKDEENFWKIRENCAYIFQNPDNQIVGTIVEEDVAFGPENLGIPNPELRNRVDEALRYVGLSEFSKKQAANLSGGQKQKLAIAGAIAMKPEILIMDESTAMLDPDSREDVLKLASQMNKDEGKTIVMITHDMFEAARADVIHVIENGKVTMSGTPSEIFADSDKLRKASLDVPEYIDFYNEICDILGHATSKAAIVSEEICAENIVDIISNSDISRVSLEPRVYEESYEGSTIMSIRDLSHKYGSGEKNAIENISFDVKKGEILAIVGKSGCGKTTLISHFNGIIRPQEGDVRIVLDNGDTISTTDKKDITRVRQNVGLVFQYPEYQLFEETVYKDVAYGLRKLNLSKEEERERVIEALKKVRFDISRIDDSPFELSGGQKRRVAIAGVIVMNPKILVLDEPASGLDPQGRKEMFQMIEDLRDSGTTIILVSHNMDEAARYADRICCIKDGQMMDIMNAYDLFENEEKVRKFGIAMPRLLSFSSMVKTKLASVYPGILFEGNANTPLEEAKAVIRSVKSIREAKNVK